MGLVLGMGALILLAGAGFYLAYHFVIARWIVALLMLAIAVALLARYMIMESEEQAELDRIDPAQIRLELDFSPARAGGFTPRGYKRYVVAGRLFNDSGEYALKEVGLRVRIEDCPAGQPENDTQSDGAADADECIVVSEGRAAIDAVVPPNQARDFVQEVRLPDFVPQGEPRWAWDVAYIRASGSE